MKHISPFDTRSVFSDNNVAFSEYITFQHLRSISLDTEIKKFFCISFVRHISNFSHSLISVGLCNSIAKCPIFYFDQGFSAEMITK